MTDDLLTNDGRVAGSTSGLRLPRGLGYTVNPVPPAGHRTECTRDGVSRLRVAARRSARPVSPVMIGESMPAPVDLLVRNARLPRATELRHLAIRDGVFVDLGEAYAGARETIDAAGGLVTSALVEPHIHL